MEFMQLKHLATDLTLHERGGVMYRLNHEDKVSKNPWGILGGFCLAKAEHPANSDVWVHHAMLQFHGGRQVWMVENERWSRTDMYPRDDHFGSLPAMMKKFKQLTGCDVPEVTLRHVGSGIVRVTPDGEKWNSKNPWELVPGAVYRVYTDRGTVKEYEAVSVQDRVEVRIWRGDVMGWSETFDPNMVITGAQWEMIRKINDQQERADEAVETDSPDGPS